MKKRASLWSDGSADADSRGLRLVLQLGTASMVPEYI